MSDENKIFQYNIPDENGNVTVQNTQNNSVIIIGANGSGKSKLGAWIEQKNMANIHRIGAQRNLNFNEDIALKSYQQAEDLVFWGSNLPNYQPQKLGRWNSGKSYTTKLMDDFENVLAALIALRNKEHEKFVEEYKISEKEKKVPPKASYTSIDKLKNIWNQIFPQRQLKVVDAKFLAYFNANGTTVEYSSNQMSDGERAALYLISQVLCVPQDKTLIIDEPEVHLHRSIMNRLWQTLENYRPDCLFIYITHDTHFAAMHKSSDKIWIKEFDGKNWQLERIDNRDIPEDLLLDILGNRKNVLFVEGDSNSYDTKLYQELYPDYYIVPCGSCTQVILRTKAFHNNPSLHHCQVFGIIDRDFRSDYEIEEYKKDNIFTLNVAEVENLFLVQELLELVADNQGLNRTEIFSAISNYILNQRFEKQINGQVCRSVSAQIKYLLSTADIKGKKEDEILQSLTDAYSNIKFDEIKTREEAKFRAILTSKNYKDVLRIFNEKGLLSSIGSYFGLENKGYADLILRLLNRCEKKQNIVVAISPYLPPEVPR